MAKPPKKKVLQPRLYFLPITRMYHTGDDWNVFEDDRGEPYWVHAASGQATYQNPYVNGGGFDGGGGYDEGGGFTGGGFGPGAEYGAPGDYSGGDGFGGGEGFGSADPATHVGWLERGRCVDSPALAVGRAPAAASALAFDDYHELLWVGRGDGFVQAFDLEVCCCPATLHRPNCRATATPQRRSLLLAAAPLPRTDSPQAAATRKLTGGCVGRCFSRWRAGPGLFSALLVSECGGGPHPRPPLLCRGGPPLALPGPGPPPRARRSTPGGGASGPRSGGRGRDPGPAAAAAEPRSGHGLARTCFFVHGSNRGECQLRPLFPLAGRG